MKAGIAQLVEYKLPKLGVASSNLVARSKKAQCCKSFLGRSKSDSVYERGVIIFSYGYGYELTRFYSTEKAFIDKKERALARFLFDLDFGGP